MTNATNEASDLTRFLESNIAFLEPDDEIMRDHRMAPRSSGARPGRVQSWKTRPSTFSIR